MSKPLLQLDTLVVRPKIAIDGVLHDILSPDELPVLTNHLLAFKGRRMEELLRKPDLQAKEKKELESVVLEISDAIMEPVPVEARAKLSDMQRMSVIEAFSTLLLTKKAGTAAALLRGLLPEETPTQPKPRPSTGGKRSRGSSGSTDAPLSGGSPKPRAR